MSKTYRSPHRTKKKQSRKAKALRKYEQYAATYASRTHTDD